MKPLLLLCVLLAGCSRTVPSELPGFFWREDAAPRVDWKLYGGDGVQVGVAYGTDNCSLYVEWPSYKPLGTFYPGCYDSAAASLKYRRMIERAVSEAMEAPR